MNALVTGAQSPFARKLIAELKRSFPKGKVMACPKAQASKESIAALKKGSGIVFHLPGLTEIRNNSIEQAFGENFLTTIHLLESLAAMKSPIAFFFASTVAVYGNPKEPTDEDSLPHPRGPLAFTKYLAEESLRSHARQKTRLRVIIGRLAGKALEDMSVAPKILALMSRESLSRYEIFNIGKFPRVSVEKFENWSKGS